MWGIVDSITSWLTRDEPLRVRGPIVATTRRELARLAASPHRILVGPWLSEVGFELLYWIPFLNWAARHYGLHRERLIVVTRGGAGEWYRHLTDHVVDLFSFWTIDDYRLKNHTRWTQDGHQPQYMQGNLDGEVFELMRLRFPGEALERLHPALMHQLFRPYWYEKGGFNLLRKHTEYCALPPAGHRIDGLPAEYFAAKFYFSPTFPDTAENRQFVTSIVRDLGQRIPVVMLNTGMLLDDHEDVPVPKSPGVLSAHHLMTPKDNLAVQTRLISHSRALVGTYGGLSYLASLCGVPALGFYSDDVKLLPAHVDVGHRLGRIMNAPLTLLRVDQSPLLGSAIGRFAHGLHSSSTVSPTSGDER